MNTAEKIVAKMADDETLVVINGEPCCVIETGADAIRAVQVYAEERGFQKWRCVPTPQSQERVFQVTIVDQTPRLTA